MEPVIKEKRILIGFVLIAVGVILSLERMNVFFFPDWVISWQMLLITIGTFSILVSGRAVPGVILIGVGSFFLINNYFHHLGFNLFAIWPLFLVVAGILIIISISTSGGNRSHKNRRHSDWRSPSSTSDSNETNSGSSEDIVDEVAIFGGGRKNIFSKNFRGGKMTAIFGGSELDLTEAELGEGDNVLEVVAMFGGWELHVPSHWNVEVNVTPVFGGFDDKRRKMSNEPIDNTRKLIIRGTVIFGGGEINNHIVRK